MEPRILYLCVMLRDWLIKILLFPFSLLYGFAISIRNFLYSQDVLKSVKFSVPIISIGNITVGGTGKTPHVEYLVRHLQPYINVSIMSRGYKRKTKGFRMATIKSTVKEVGDEPLQYKLKFPHIPIAVAESRALGIPDLLGRNPHIQTVILDDAFQHRSVEPHLNILLTTHKNPYFRDFLLPSGRLREWPAGATRADAIIVTKCPPSLSDSERREWIETLELEKYQSVFFSTMKYSPPYSYFNTGIRLDLNDLDGVVLISAIADSQYMEEHIDQYVDRIISMSFEDHHYFEPHEIGRLIKNFQEMKATKKAVITTEKDAVRLIPHREELHKHKIPVYLLPIQVEFLFKEIHNFDEYLKAELMKIRV